MASRFAVGLSRGVANPIKSAIAHPESIELRAESLLTEALSVFN